MRKRPPAQTSPQSNAARVILLSILAGYGTAGCLAIPRQLAAPEDSASPPSGHSVQRPSFIVQLQGPDEATVGRPVTIEAWASAGSDGCDTLGRTIIQVDHVSRTATVSATISRWEGPGIGCPQMFPGYRKTTITFTPEATGTYLVSGAPFVLLPGYAFERLGAGATASATLSIQVVSASASVLATGNHY